jgi:hypothetical protein
MNLAPGEWTAPAQVSLGPASQAMRSSGTVGKVFLISCCVLLCLTALAKFTSAFGQAKILDFPDPLWGISNRQLLLAVAALEFGVAAFILAPVPIELKFLATAWLGANFLLYRFAAMLKPGKLCPCLGSITERFQINETAAAYILSAIAFYMFCGGLTCYFRRKRQSSEGSAVTAS